MFKVPEEFRLIEHEMFGSDASYGNNGVFVVPYSPKDLTKASMMTVIASDGEGWDHVSVTTRYPRCPTWEEMCYIKSLFWHEDDVVIQYHPAKVDYVNNHDYCLHLWRSQDYVIPTPPSIMVGFKS